MDLDTFLKGTGQSCRQFGKQIKKDHSYVYRIAIHDSWPARETWMDIEVASSGMVTPNDQIKAYKRRMLDLERAS